MSDEGYDEFEDDVRAKLAIEHGRLRRRKQARWLRRWNLSLMVAALLAIKVYELVRRRP